MDTGGVDAGLLRSRYRLTKQRAAVLQALDDGAHLTAEALLERVRIQLPGVSLGTIYRTVDILREIGLVQMFTHNGMAARYEASLSKHHHLVCDICRDITNVNVPSLTPVMKAIAGQYHYDDVDASLTVTGRCASCAAEAAAGAAEAAAPAGAVETAAAAAGSEAHAATPSPGTWESRETTRREFEGTVAHAE